MKNNKYYYHFDCLMLIYSQSIIKLNSQELLIQIPKSFSLLSGQLCLLVLCFFGLIALVFDFVPIQAAVAVQVLVLQPVNATHIKSFIDVSVLVLYNVS